MSKYQRLSLSEIRAVLKLKPPPWVYCPETGTLTSEKFGTPIRQFVYNGIYLNPRAIRVFLHCGFYPDPEKIKPPRPDLRLNMIEYCFDDSDLS